MTLITFSSRLLRVSKRGVRTRFWDWGRHKQRNRRRAAARLARRARGSRQFMITKTLAPKTVVKVFVIMNRAGVSRRVVRQLGWGYGA